MDLLALAHKVKGRATDALGAMERRLPVRTFDRPIFVIAMPRSGSTLLFDLLRVHEGTRSWGDEAYPPWLAIDGRIGIGPLGDAFRSESLDPGARRRAEWTMHHGVAEEEKRLGRSHGFLDRRGLVPYRLVEKTPSNVLRVLDLDRLFPDARFVFLTRDAPANIASLTEAWERGLAPRAYTQERGQEWGMMMPPGWEDHVGRTPTECCAFQWEAGNEAALADFARIDGERVHHIRYEDLIASAPEEMRRILAFAELDPSAEVEQAAEALRPSKVVLSAPRPDKWLSRWPDLHPLMPDLAHLRRRLGYDPDGDPAAPETTAAEAASTAR